MLGLRHKDLRVALNLSESAISRRFTGDQAWSLDEMYKLMDMCHAPAEELHLYFPKGGISA